MKKSIHSIFRVGLLYLLSLLLTVSVISGCASSYETYAYDDLYSVKPSDYPPYESVADETSYAVFKQNKAQETPKSSQVDRNRDTDPLPYEYESFSAHPCVDLMYWYNGCGCSYSTWQRTSRYSAYNRSNYTIVVFPSLFTYSYAPFYSYNYWYPSYYWGLYSGWHGSLYSGGYYPFYSPYGMPYPYYGYGYHTGYGYFGGYPYSHGMYLKNGTTSSDSYERIYRGHRNKISTGHANQNDKIAVTQALKSGSVDQHLVKVKDRVVSQAVSNTETVTTIRPVRGSSVKQDLQTINAENKEPTRHPNSSAHSTSTRTVNRNYSEVDRTSTQYAKPYPVRSSTQTTNVPVISREKSGASPQVNPPQTPSVQRTPASPQRSSQPSRSYENKPTRQAVPAQPSRSRTTSSSGNATRSTSTTRSSSSSSTSSSPARNSSGRSR